MSRKHRQDPGHSEDAYTAPPWAILAAVLFCLIFAGVGLFHLIPSLAPWFWKSVPCEVLQFEVTDHAKAKLPFTAQARYRFEWEGNIHESTHVGIAGWKDAATPLTLARRLSENGKGKCYLPDGLPEKAVLLRPPPKWNGLFFVGFGVCVGWILIQAHLTRNLSQQETGRRILPAVALFFGTPGLVLTLGLSLPVWVESLEVLGWKETPATIIWSEVRSTRSTRSRGNAIKHHADICYEYEAAGRSWKSNGIRPGDAGGFDHTSAAGLAASYPEGLKTLCYVHPTRPERAVLLTSPGWTLALTLFPLPFLAVGIYLAREVMRSRRPPPTRSERIPRKSRTTSRW